MDYRFLVPAGKTVVITGSSGAGKSSILKILLRFYEQSSGSILINGQDIAKVNAKSLREAMAIVPQIPVLRNESIYENIKYANPSATYEEIENAASLAGLNQVIEEHGMDFQVGENGGKLSGGQRQRLAIARAYLRKNASILVLDEATSSLDPKTEKAILVDLDNLLKNSKKTAVIVTHRLASIRHLSTVDSIVFLDGGKIVEQGTLSQLMAKDGLFAAQMKIADAEEDLDQKRQPASIITSGLRLPNYGGVTSPRSLSQKDSQSLLSTPTKMKRLSETGLGNQRLLDDNDDDLANDNNNNKRTSAFLSYFKQ
jgi:ATP-binding cassette subfamily B protein